MLDKHFIKNRKRILNTFISILLLWLCGHLIYITIDGLTDKNKQVDVAVVLGQYPERLEKRMECGLSLYNSGRFKK